MLCQKCQKNNATVHVKQTVNGVKTEMLLCSECAEKENIGSFFPSDNLFSGFFSDSIFGGEYLKEQKKCPLCGSTRSDLAKTGRAGCAKCYEVFEEELKKMIYGIHGNAVHTGAVPGKHLADIEKRKEIEQLKKEQQQAVLEQNYEQAAVIRDKIKELEKSDKEEK